MANDGVGDGIFLLSYFRMLLYQKQNIQGCTPDQAGHSYQLYIYDALHLSKRIHISVYNGEIRPAPGQKRLVMVMIPMVKNSFFFITFLFGEPDTLTTILSHTSPSLKICIGRYHS